MQVPIFDQPCSRLRRARAARMDGDRFLYIRALDDCLHRLAGISSRFRSVVIIDDRPEQSVAAVAAALPGANVTALTPADMIRQTPGAFDLCLSIGELETSEDLATAIFIRRQLLAPGGLILGTIVGGESLPLMRSAMLAADQSVAGASPRVHPMIDGPALAALLGSVDLRDPIIEVDRVSVHYASFDQLVRDLRSMGCTNILTQRSRRAISRVQLAVARHAFLAGATYATERFELLHFTAWAPEGGGETTN